MTLVAADIERWARQIILPEVGGRGQERLLGAAAAVYGRGGAAHFAAELLARAGLRTDGVIPCDVVLDFSADGAGLLSRGRLARDARRPFIAVVTGGDTAEVATLVGRPCIDCASLVASGAEPAAPLAMALGAIAAAEALRVVLAPAAVGRLQTLDLHTGALATRALEDAGCAACRPATP